MATIYEVAIRRNETTVKLHFSYRDVAAQNALSLGQIIMEIIICEMWANPPRISIFLIHFHRTKFYCYKKADLIPNFEIGDFLDPIKIFSKSSGEDEFRYPSLCGIESRYKVRNLAT